MKRSPHSQRRGFSLSEMVISCAISVTVFGLSIDGLITLQRSFMASDYQSTSQNDQLRVSDYLALDLRPATSVTISRGGQQMDLVIPSSTASITQIHLDIPVLGPLLSGPPPPAPRQVTYSVAGNQLYRIENGARVLIAQNVTAFVATQTGSTVTISSSFQPQYSGDPSKAPQNFTTLFQTVLARYAAL